MVCPKCGNEMSYDAGLTYCLKCQYVDKDYVIAFV
jgi:transcription initiation factor TFIIIB Brf1 subunit/transcription initiation factor TFIIB